MKKGLMAKVVVLAVVLAAGGLAGLAGAAEIMLGDEPDGSRATPIHLIPMLVEPMAGKEPDQIHLGDALALPFSTKATCGACHSYDIISAGWHFNAIDTNVGPGRNGQAWILADPAAATQIPLSYRNWPGTFRPQQLGITPAAFLQLFGRQMPGGGIGEMVDKTENPDEVLRAGITGQLEINCLACHNVSPGEDMGSAAGYAWQIIRGNYRWAATASSEFAYVTGTTKGLNDYDFRAPFVSDTKLRPPAIEYKKDAFGHNDWVRFDVSREIPKQRCYFCHSSVDVRDGKTEQWDADEDVHLAAGLTCVDCHSHGLAHNITRGYAAEPCDSNNPLAAVSSCEGCHLGKNITKPVAGRFAAPTPKHAGIPSAHFDKLTCTACHSGPWPSAETIRVKTSRAHALGVAGANKSGDVLPHLTYPVFAKGQDGKIGVFKLFWPAYWATQTGETITPLDLDTVRSATTKVIAKSALSKVGDWPGIEEEDIAKILSLLVAKVPAGAKPVYVTGGKLYSLDKSNKIASSEHKMAAPYMWPIAHDIRPAAQSLGVRRCEDCHSTSSPFLFGIVSVDSPLKVVAATGPSTSLRAGREMVEFEALPRSYTRAFAFSFVFRPWLKVVAILSAVVIAGVLLLYVLKALGFVAKVVVGNVIEKERPQRIEHKGGPASTSEAEASIIGVLRMLVFLLALICFVALMVTGFVPVYVFGKSITGWWLIVHATAAPVFAACMAILAVLWADRNRLDKNYWPWLNWILNRQPKSTIPPAKYELELKVCFWAILALTLAVILSAVLSMFRLFGTDIQELLLQLHRYSTLLLSLFAIVYLYLAAMTEMNRTSVK